MPFPQVLWRRHLPWTLLDPWMPTQLPGGGLGEQQMAKCLRPCTHIGDQKLLGLSCPDPAVWDI